MPIFVVSWFPDYSHQLVPKRVPLFKTSRCWATKVVWDQAAPLLRKASQALPHIPRSDPEPAPGHIQGSLLARWYPLLFFCSGFPYKVANHKKGCPCHNMVTGLLRHPRQEVSSQGEIQPGGHGEIHQPGSKRRPRAIVLDVGGVPGKSHHLLPKCCTVTFWVGPWDGLGFSLLALRGSDLGIFTGGSTFRAKLAFCGSSVICARFVDMERSFVMSGLLTGLSCSPFSPNSTVLDMERSLVTPGLLTGLSCSPFSPNSTVLDMERSLVFSGLLPGLSCSFSPKATVFQ